MEKGDDVAKLRILLTNDDGVQAPGLRVLAQALAELGDVTIIAPEHNWSASGHSKTMHKPLRVSETQLESGQPAFVASGSPSDCVALALLGLVDPLPDLVVSGINQGANVGQDLTYSGTVSAAMEAVISGVPSMAVSLDSYTSQRFVLAARVAHLVSEQVLATRDVVQDEQPLLLNVNVPDPALGPVKGLQITRLGRRLYRDALITREDPRGRSYYWIGGDPPAGIPEEGTDIGALAKGYVSITPIALDLTDERRLPLLRKWKLGLPSLD